MAWEENKKRWVHNMNLKLQRRSKNEGDKLSFELEELEWV